MTNSEVWGVETAARYDSDEADRFAPVELGPTVEFLAGLAGGGRALEFAIGTGRVAVPLLTAGVAVCGIEPSEAMLAELRRKVDAGALPVAHGDMATTRVPGEFALVYLVYNTLGNLRTQAEQIECFRNAARHLSTGGRFVIEIGVPPLRRLPPGQLAVPFHIGEGHVGFDTFDVVSQRCTSHHYTREPDGSVRYDSGNFRYVWPAECDVMAVVAGLELEARYADWHRAPFTAESERHVSVWRKP